MKTAYIISRIISAINIVAGVLTFIYLSIGMSSSSGSILLDILVGIGCAIGIGLFSIPAVFIGILSLILANISHRNSTDLYGELKISAVVLMVLSYAIPIIFDAVCISLIFGN